MQDYEIPQLVRQIIREELAPILMGKVVSTKDDRTASAQRFSGESQLDKLRLLMPAGFATRPKAGTECVVMPIASDPTHLNILTQYDASAPKIDTEGEVCLYGPDGAVIYLHTGKKITQGSKTADEPVVLGNVLMEFLGKVLDQLINAPQIGFDSFSLQVFLDPTVKAQLILFKQQYLTAPSTNIVGQKNFVERGDS